MTAKTSDVLVTRALAVLASHPYGVSVWADKAARQVSTQAHVLRCCAEDDIIDEARMELAASYASRAGGEGVVSEHARAVIRGTLGASRATAHAASVARASLRAGLDSYTGSVCADADLIAYYCDRD